MSEIIPGRLFLGDYDDVRDEEFLNKNKILTIICVARELTIKTNDMFVEIYHFPIDDYSSSNIHEYFDTIADLIKLKKNVLVHCLAGVNRSPTIVMAFLIKYQGMSPNEAFSYVKQLRDEIDPDPEFMKHLEKYYSTLTLRKNKEVHP